MMLLMHMGLSHVDSWQNFKHNILRFGSFTMYNMKTYWSLPLVNKRGIICSIFLLIQISISGVVWRACRTFNHSVFRLYLCWSCHTWHSETNLLILNKWASQREEISLDVSFTWLSQPVCLYFFQFCNPRPTALFIGCLCLNLFLYFVIFYIL